MAPKKELTKKELISELRKYKDAKVGGNKHSLTTQYEDFQRREAAGEDVLVADVEVQSGAVGAEDPAPVGQDNEAETNQETVPAVPAKLLPFLLFHQPLILHPITIKCIHKLTGHTFVLRARAAVAGDNTRSAEQLAKDDAHLAKALAPVENLVETIARVATAIVQDDVATPSTTRNMQELSIRLAKEIGVSEVDPRAQYLFKIFGLDVIGLSLAEEESLFVEQDESSRLDQDIDQAIANSLLSLQTDDERREASNEDAPMEQGEAAIDISDDVIKRLVPEEGIWLNALIIELQMHRLSMIDLEEKTRYIVSRSFIDFDPTTNLITLKASSNDDDQFPSDQVVQEGVAAVSGGIDFMDLIKLGDVRRLGIDAARSWADNLVARNVLRYVEATDLFILGTGSIISRRAMPVTTPAVQRPGDQDSQASFAESADTSTEEVKDVAQQLDAQLLRIQEAIIFFLRNWFEDFPEPEVGFWPDDFKTAERAKIRQHIHSYLIDNAVTLLAADIDDARIKAAVDTLLADDSFPVAKGRNRACIQQVVKLIRAEKMKIQRKAAEKESRASESVAAEEELSDEEEE